MVKREFQIKPLHSCVLFLLREHGVIAGDYIAQSYTSCMSFKNICFFGDSSSHCTKKRNDNCTECKGLKLAHECVLVTSY